MKQKSLLTWEKNKHKKANSKNLQQRGLWLNHLTAMKHWLLGGSVREDGGGGGLGACKYGGDIGGEGK